MTILLFNLGVGAMTKDRIYSSYTREAASLLGKQIRLGRKQRKWTEQELAERAGLDPDLGCWWTARRWNSSPATGG